MGVKKVIDAKLLCLGRDFRVVRIPRQQRRVSFSKTRSLLAAGRAKQIHVLEPWHDLGTPLKSFISAHSSNLSGNSKGSLNKVLKRVLTEPNEKQPLNSGRVDPFIDHTHTQLKHSTMTREMMCCSLKMAEKIKKREYTASYSAYIASVVCH